MTARRDQPSSVDQKGRTVTLMNLGLRRGGPPEKAYGKVGVSLVRSVGKMANLSLRLRFRTRALAVAFFNSEFGRGGHYIQRKDGTRWTSDEMRAFAKTL